MSDHARRLAGHAVLIAALVLSVATSSSPPAPPPSVPMWAIASQPLVLACGTADVWVAKSGKTGLGITVRIAPKREEARPVTIAIDPADVPAGAPPAATPCAATIAATIRFADRAFPGRLVVQRRGDQIQAHERQAGATYDRNGVEVGTVDPSLIDATFYYLAFELDNEARWNRGDRTATVELSIEAGGKRETWTLPATHAYREWPVRQR